MKSWLPTVAVAVGLAASVSVIGSTILVLVDLDASVAPPRALPAIGAPEFAIERCAHDGIEYVIDGDQVWVPCAADTPGMPRGGLMRFDPNGARAEIAWPIPDGAPAWFEGLGVLGGRDRVAFAYRVAVPENGGSSTGGVAVLIAAADGLAARPVLLDPDPRTVLAGLAWSDETLHVALRGPGTENESLRGDAILHELPSGRRTVVPNERLCRALDATCRIVGGYRIGNDWRFVLAGMRPGSRDWLWSATIAGEIDPIASPRFERSHIDLSRAGLLPPADLASIGFALRADGRIEAVPQPRTALIGGYELTDDGLVVRPRIAGPDRATVVHEVGERSPSVHLEPGPPARLLVDRTAVASVLPSTGDFLRGAFVPRHAGGTFLLSREGQYVALDAAGDRVDRPGPVEHARMLHDDAPYRIFWVFGGLPVLVTVALLFAARWRRRGLARALSIAVAVACGAFVAVSLIVALPDLWALTPPERASPRDRG